ncbi:MAG TPA: FtsX-like permease family protein [Gemmatimonadales bacterium]|nr:FtsX-like permease family protein [Gemmatimonadales bacterium]
MPHTPSSTRPHQTFRAAISSTLGGLRLDHGTAILIGLAAAAALAALLPVVSLVGSYVGGGRPGLEISTVGGGRLGLPWSDAMTPGETQAQGTAALFGLLLGVAVATFGTASITVVALVGARDAARSADNAVRRAVGASRATIRNAALLEAAAIAAVALGVGWLLGMGVGRLAIAGWPGEIARSQPGASLMAALATAAVVILSGLLPVIFARTEPLAEADRAPRQIFVPASAQFAASIAVLVTAALVARQAGETLTTDAVSGTTGVVELSTAGHDRAELGRRYAALLDRLEADSLPASLTSPGAITGLGTTASVMTDCGDCSEGGLPSRYQAFYATHHIVSPDSFQALGIHLAAGRALQSRDRAGARRVAVVNRALAARHFQHGEAIGRAMQVGDDKQWYTVVGIVDDAPAWGFGARFQPRFTVYLSILQHPPSSAELLVPEGGGPGVVGRVRQHVTAELGPADVRTQLTRLADLHAREAAPVEWFARWIGFQGWVTTLLACIGMFAVMRIWVRALIPELGVRRAMGASRRRLAMLVAAHAGAVVIGGVVTGCWFGWSVWSVLPTILRGAATWDLSAVLAAAFPLAVATLAGALLPAWRALRRGPVELMAAAG